MFINYFHLDFKKVDFEAKKQIKIPNLAFLWLCYTYITYDTERRIRKNTQVNANKQNQIEKVLSIIIKNISINKWFINN